MSWLALGVGFFAGAMAYALALGIWIEARR
jgi:hypothetical protein